MTLFDFIIVMAAMLTGFVFGWCARVAIERAQRSIKLAEQERGESV